MIRRKSILVVDDDRMLRQMYRTALLLAGFRVDSAEDGISALRRIDECRPDLIVLDLHLPRLDGLTVLSELRSNSDTWSIPVVVVTGADYQYAVAQANAILRKPCEPEKLLSVIEQHLTPAA
jgi:DNA-binding response OmpR family regulator